MTDKTEYEIFREALGENEELGRLEGMLNHPVGELGEKAETNLRKRVYDALIESGLSGDRQPEQIGEDEFKKTLGELHKK